MEELNTQSIPLQTEFDEWVQNGCNKAKELVDGAEDNNN